MIEAPAGITVSKEVMLVPREWADRRYHPQCWTVMMPSAAVSPRWKCRSG
jgi:hypothetical protein